MTIPLTPARLAEIEARAAKACKHISELAAEGDRKWRMCVPPQADDSDMLLTRVTEDARELCAEVHRLTAALAAAEAREARLREGLEIYAYDDWIDRYIDLVSSGVEINWEEITRPARTALAETAPPTEHELARAAELIAEGR